MIFKKTLFDPILGYCYACGERHQELMQIETTFRQDTYWICENCLLEALKTLQEKNE